MSELGVLCQIGGSVESVEQDGESVEFFPTFIPHPV